MRLQTNDMQGFINQLETDWKTMAPGQPLSYQFLDERFARMFETEQKLGKIAGIFSFLAIFIACIGLLGLATFIAQQRTKEIGIRKVLGASVTNLVAIVSKDFLQLIVLSTIIAAPLAWWSMNAWLQDFVYRIEINWWVFVVVGLVAILIAFVTIGTQSLKAALANPVESIKSE